MPKGKQSMVFM